MSEMAPFDFKGRPVRAVFGEDGEPWFIASDVADVLDLVNRHSSLAVLDDDEKGIHSVETPGGAQSVVVISEAGLYSLILRSRKPEAKVFKRWVTHEVLPAIRRTGRYEVEPAARALPQNFADALDQLAAEVRANEAAQQEIAELTPRAALADRVINATGDLSVRETAQQLARDYQIDIGERRLFAYLRDIAWIDARNLPYQRQIDTGRLTTKPRTYRHPRTGEERVAQSQVRITPKGLAELHRLMTAPIPTPPALPAQRSETPS